MFANAHAVKAACCLCAITIEGDKTVKHRASWLLSLHPSACSIFPTCIERPDIPQLSGYGGPMPTGSTTRCFSCHEGVTRLAEVAGLCPAPLGSLPWSNITWHPGALRLAWRDCSCPTCMPRSSGSAHQECSGVPVLSCGSKERGASVSVLVRWRRIRRARLAAGMRLGRAFSTT